MKFTPLLLVLLFLFSFCVLLHLKAHAIFSQQKADVLQEDLSQSPLKKLRDIHNFQTTFDDYSLGGMSYESFE